LARQTGGYIYDRRLIEFLRQQGCRVDVISVGNVWGGRSLLSPLWLIAARLQDRYDVLLEDELAHPALWLFNTWLHTTRSARVVALVHALRYRLLRGRWRRRLSRALERQMLISVESIVTVSQHLKAELIRLGLQGSRIHVVPPGVSWPASVARVPSPTSHIRLLCVANCLPAKGLHILLEALHQADDPRLHLTIVGDDRIDPAYTRRLRRLLTRWALTSRVRFTGTVPWETMADFYTAADIFVFPSLSEGFGIVLAEAMSFGLPVIATSADAIPELVHHGANGLLVPPQDPGALARATAQLASDEALRQQFGRAGREGAAGLPSWEQSARTIWILLQQPGLRAED
jgi:glycosyltransferase involved in cell wall biosynthesis